MDHYFCILHARHAQPLHKFVMSRLNWRKHINLMVRQCASAPGARPLCLPGKEPPCEA